jgi:TRAP-type C4-dicarboxylate transport system permease small subunit
MSINPVYRKIIPGFIDRLLLVSALAAEFILATLVVMVNVEILTRNIFGISIGIVDELMGYLLVAIVFLGLGKTIREGALLRCDVFIDLFSTNIARMLDRMFAIIGVLILSVYTYHLWILVAGSYRRGLVSSSGAAIPLWIPQSAMIIGALLSVIAFLVLVVQPAQAKHSEVQL